MAFLARLILACLLALLPVLACAVPSGGVAEWWKGQGPVIPHQNFPGSCSLCHTTESWQRLKPDFEFDHAVETGVELIGAHAEAQCLRCHNDRGPVQDFAARGCAGCHVDPHQGRLGQGCEDCHDQITWRAQGQIAEHGRTRFPLMGVHAALTCDRCHPGIGSGNVEPLNPECSSCHQSELAAATSPDHAAQGWVDNCQRCHLPTTWSGGGFRHDGFRLTGAHATSACEACHVGGVYSGLGSQCSDCHLNEYNGVSDPDHAGLGFSLSCDQCHSTRAWLPANFSHSGIHDGCVDCHLNDYNSASDPNHVLAGYSTECQDCHSTKSWDGAGFSHSGISNGCDACHMDDYNQTTSPNHSAAGFPVTCHVCHGTNQWQGANFDHDFDIDRGPHRNLSCNDCHLNSASYAQFSCTHCHEHRKSKMDDVHEDENGYVWESSACLSCHPDGRE